MNKNKILICTSSSGFLGGSEKTLISFLKSTRIDKNNIAIIIPKIKLNDFVQKIKGLDIKIYVIGIDKNRKHSPVFFKNFFYFFKNIINKVIYSFKLVIIILKFKPKVLYLNNIYCEAESIIGKAFRKKIIWHIKGLGEPNLFIRRIKYFLVKKLSDKIIFLTIYDQNKVFDLKKDKKILKKVIIIPEGIEISSYKELESNVIGTELEKIVKINNSSKIIIGMASIISFNKGIDIFCKTAEIFHKKNKNLIFMHVGKTKYDEKNLFYNNLLNNYHSILNKNLFFLNYLENINLFFNIIDIFFFTSRSEGLPIIVLEAMLFEKAILASNIDGNMALLENNKTGIIFKNNDFDDIENKLSMLADNKNLRSIIGKNAKKRVMDNFDVAKSIKILEEVINSYLN